MKNNLSTIKDYIAVFPPETQVILKKIRKLIAAAAPKAEEAIKYGIPTFIWQENLIHFAAYKSHVGLYPTPAVITSFQEELRPYKTSKGAIQFPLSEPIPWPLIKKIILFRIQQVKKKKI